MVSNPASIRASNGASAAISGNMTFRTVRALLDQSDSLFDEGASIRSLDLSEVEQIDSSGLALLLEWQSKAKERGYAFEILHAPADLVSLAHLCEAQELLKLKSRNTND